MSFRYSHAGAARQLAGFLNAVMLNGIDEQFRRIYAVSGARREAIVSMWIYFPTTIDVAGNPFVAGDSDGYRMQYFGSGTDQARMFETYTGAPGTVDRRSDAGTYNADVWQHILLTWNTLPAITPGSAKYRIYRDGVERPCTGNTHTDNWEIITGTDKPHTIGARWDNTAYLTANIAQFCLIVDRSIQASDYSVSDFVDTSGSTPKAKNLSDLGFIGNDALLDFSDTDDLGKDVSGLGNDYVPTNIDASNVVNGPPLASE